MKYQRMYAVACVKTFVRMYILNISASSKYMYMCMHMCLMNSYVRIDSHG